MPGLRAAAGLKSNIRFYSSTREFEIEWQQLGSTIMKLSLVFEASEPGVNQMCCFELHLAAPFDAQSVQACFKHFARTLMKQVAPLPMPNIKLPCTTPTSRPRDIAAAGRETSLAVSLRTARRRRK